MPRSWWRTRSQACSKPRTSLIPMRSRKRLSRYHRASGLRSAEWDQCLRAWSVCRLGLVAPSCELKSSGILRVALPAAPEQARSRASYRNTRFRNTPSPELSTDPCQHLHLNFIRCASPHRGPPRLPPPGCRRSSNQEYLSGHPACTPTLSSPHRLARRSRSAATTWKPCECRGELHAS